MLRNALVPAFVAVLCAATLCAQTKPNFSGTWKLNTAKSDFGVLPGPDSRTDKIEQTESAIKENVDSQGPQGNQVYTLTYTPDGKEGTNTPGGLEIKNTAKWDGPSLVIDSKLKFQDQDVTIKSTWTLSEDGKTFTMNSHLASAMGETDQKFVFDKQEGGAAPAQAATRSVVPSGAKVNLSGTWKLNVAKSDFGVLPGPDKETFVVEHNDPVIKIKVSAESAQGKQDYVIDSSTDGKEHINKVGGNDVKTTALWEGGNIVSTAKLTIQDQDVTIKNTYVLSEDGKTLTVNSHLASAMGETDQKMIFEKEI